MSVPFLHTLQHHKLALARKKRACCMYQAEIIQALYIFECIKLYWYNKDNNNSVYDI